MKNIAMLAAAAAIVSALPASAATLYSAGTLLAPTSSPASAGFSAVSAGGVGSLSFNIDGYASLDGVNYYEDDFTLNVNGVDILTLSYDLGGGGTNQIFTNTSGAVVTGGAFSYSVAGNCRCRSPRWR